MFFFTKTLFACAHHAQRTFVPANSPNLSLLPIVLFHENLNCLCTLRTAHICSHRNSPTYAHCAHRTQQLEKPEQQSLTSLAPIPTIFRPISIIRYALEQSYQILGHGPQFLKFHPCTVISHPVNKSHAKKQLFLFYSPKCQNNPIYLVSK